MATISVEFTSGCQDGKIFNFEVDEATTEEEILTIVCERLHLYGLHVLSTEKLEND